MGKHAQGHHKNMMPKRGDTTRSPYVPKPGNGPVRYAQQWCYSCEDSHPYHGPV